MLLDFFNIVANLKTIPRKGWIDKLKIEQPESVSDHTFSTTVMAMIFSDMKKLDTLKVLKMSLLHDLAESITGDLTPDQISKDRKYVFEKKEMEQILKKLPNQLNQDLMELWGEFQENISPEAKIIHQVDKLEMILQAKIYEKNGYGGIKPFLDSAEKDIHDEQLKELFNQIINQ